LQVYRIHVLGPLSDRALVGDYDILMSQCALTNEALVSNELLFKLLLLRWEGECLTESEIPLQSLIS
jgi:hypothetical protein